MGNARAKAKSTVKSTAKRDKSTKVAKVEKVEKVAQVAKVEKVEKAEKVDRQQDIKISAQPEPFRLVSIERTEPPSGASGKNWYRYNIRQGTNAINGYLQGTANGVKHTAEQIVGQLNERRAGRWGYRTTRVAAPAQSG
jgi:hypothetical protein